MFLSDINWIKLISRRGSYFLLQLELKLLIKALSFFYIYTLILIMV